MKNKAYRNSKTKHQLLSRKQRGVKQVVWRLNSEQRSFIEDDLGMETSPALYVIRTRKFYELKGKGALLKTIHFSYKRGKRTIVRELKSEDRKLLDSILALPVTDEDLEKSEEKSKRLYHGLCKINVGAFAGAIGNYYYDYAYNLLRTAKKSFDKKGFLEREFHDRLEYYSEKDEYLIRERDCTEEERKYVEGVMELYPNEMEYILPSKQLIK